MKRLAVLLLALALVLSASACMSRATHDPYDHEELPLRGEEPQLPSSGTDASSDTDASGTDAPGGSQAEGTPADSGGPDAGETTGTSQPPEAAEEPYVRVVDPEKPMVALTFDDGPHAVYTDMLLDILEENHAVATFFEVGRNVAACPDPLQRMVELGCEIGSHSYAHKDLSKLKPAALAEDLAAADQAFIDAVGFAPLLLRPPYGAVNKTVKTATGRSVITWTVDTEDWLSRDTDKVVSYVQSLSQLDGEIILLHSPYESTVEAVRILVPWLIQEGYQLVTVSELMAYYYGELLQPNEFHGYTYFTTHGRTDTPAALPAEPTAPEAPSLSEEPAQPTTPSAPQEPAQPEEPAQPTTPSAPQEPAAGGESFPAPSL